MKLTPGKLAGLKKVSNERGVIAAAAMDQRGSLQKSLSKEKGGGEVTDAMMEEFKTLVSEVLTPHATAILLDPEWGLPASKRRAKNAGLLLAYEKTGYDKTGPGRLPDLLDHWSARRLKKPAPTASRFCSITRQTIPSMSTKPSMHGSSALAMNAAPTTSRTSSSSLGTKRVRTRRAPNTRRRNHTSSPRACASSAKTATASTC